MQNANSILITKSSKEDYKYNVRVEYHTRLFTEEVKSDEELLTTIKDNLYGEKEVNMKQ
jgi:hypothetical protein